MGVIVNALAIVIAGFIGLQIQAGIPERIHQRMMEGIGLAVIAIGISGAIQGKETLVMIISLLIGIIIGEGIDIDRRMIKGIDWLKERFLSGNNNGNQITQGFISASMIFCIGSMAIVGSLESGLTGDNTTLFTKSILDGITALLLSSSLGLGVMLSAIPVFILQGSIFLFASILEPFLVQAVIVEIISVGSLLMIGLGLNIMGVTKLKIMNFTPATLLPIIIMLFI